MKRHLTVGGDETYRFDSQQTSERFVSKNLPPCASVVARGSCRYQRFACKEGHSYWDCSTRCEAEGERQPLQRQWQQHHRPATVLGSRDPPC